MRERAMNAVLAASLEEDELLTNPGGQKLRP